jgi:ribosomal protein S18 acetylase RimI-like enzyme
MAAPRIERLDHRDLGVASRLHAVLVAAHAQEVGWLQNLPGTALDSSPDQIQRSAGMFFGALHGTLLVGALSLGPDDEPGQIQVTTLIVDPAWQRQGIARALLADTIARGEGLTFSVVAGAANAPALALYAALGFIAYRRGEMGPGAVPVVKLRRVPPAGR